MPRTDATHQPGQRASLPTLALAIAAALLAMQTVVGSAIAGEPGAGDQIDFTLPDLNGGKVPLSKWRGHPLIVDFWATWCGPCRRQVPELQSLYQRYHKSRGLVVVGVACDTIQGSGIGAIRPFLEEFEVSYPILVATEGVIDKLGVEAIPTTFFIDSSGRLVTAIVGAGHHGELTEHARALLDGKGGHHGPPSPEEREPPGGGHIINISAHVVR